MTVRVLHILDHSLPLHSGYTFRTASLLREQRKLGWETLHLTSPKHEQSSGRHDGALQEQVDHWTFHRTPMARASGLPVLREMQLMRALERRIDTLIQEHRPHILHAHSPVLNALPAARAARRAGLPVVYEIRAFWEDAAVDHGTTTEGSLRYKATRALETRAMKRVDHVFTICEGLRGDILGRGIPASKVSVIPNAVDIASFEPGGQPDPELQAQLGLQGAKVLGFIGSFYAYEGLDLLLEALPQMLQRDPSVRLLLVGGGPQDAALKAQCQALGLADKVVFTGRVPHAQVQRYYDLIDVLVFPRHPMRLTELVTPLKPLEAMAQGRLLVASDVGGHKELIEDGQTGHLFKAGDRQSLADVVMRVLSAPADWPRVQANGRRFVEDVRNWRNSAANYVPVYERLLGRSVA